jgi:hypothetical protein
MILKDELGKYESHRLDVCGEGGQKMATAVLGRGSVPQARFRYPIQGFLSRWKHVVTTHRRPRPHAPQDPSGVAHWRNDPLVRVCHLRRHSRYHRGQEFALELLQTVSRDEKQHSKLSRTHRVRLPS